MNEEVLLEEMLALAEDQDNTAAYDALMARLPELGPAPSPQVYYFLSCFAGGSHRANAALDWLVEAIDRRGYWYRPKVLEDDDLADISEHPVLIRLKALSDARYEAAAAVSAPRLTWVEKRAPKLLVALHGNGQNAEIARSDWSGLAGADVQVEAMQSSVVDSFGRYRWNYDEENYLEFVSAMKPLSRARYTKRIFAGFSAGCDVLLRTVLRTELRVNVLLLQSPYIPIIETELPALAKALREKEIELRIFCGALDRDCCPMAEQLFYAAADAGANVTFHRQQGLRHRFPPALGAPYRV